MFYYADLDKIIFEQYPKNADEFKILSGYVGPSPINDLQNLPFPSTVIQGLFYENQNKRLHDQVVKMDNDKVHTYYPTILSHSKCYVWLENGVPIKGLIGSANFSSNGLKNSLRESLYEIESTMLSSLDEYINIILSSSKLCIEVEANDKKSKHKHDTSRNDSEAVYVSGQADLSFLDNTGKVPDRSGLNWGAAPTSNVSKSDAYVAIRVRDINNHPEIFHPRSSDIGLNHKRFDTSEVIELIWDDGFVMQARFEATQPVGGEVYPKQLTSFPRKNILGLYIRKRLSLNEGTVITKEHLDAAHVDSLRLVMIEEGIFSASLVSSK
jgi:hypothetical protein